MAEAQAVAGHEVTVLTQLPAGAPERETINGVDVVRVAPPTPSVPREPDQLVLWVDLLDSRMAEAGADIVGRIKPDVVHAHDWVVAQAAEAIRRKRDAPLVVTVHATEAGRHQGWITSDISRRIHGIEHVLTGMAQRIITCSTAMCNEVSKVFSVEPDRIDVIPNGIDLGHWQIAASSRAYARRQFAPAGSHLVVYIGRLEWEKGVHTLIDAVGKLSTPLENLHVVIVGTGTYEAVLKHQATELIENGVIKFLGWVPEDELQAVGAAADVAVVPSLYEPFGLVALEAGALGVPVVVARTGGLADIVKDGVSGRIFEAGNASELAAVIDEVLFNPAAATHRANQLTALLFERYDWRIIAKTTNDTYARAIGEAQMFPRPREIRAPPPPDGNVFT